MHDGPHQQAADGDEAIELVVVDESVVHAVHLAGARRTGGHRDGDPDLGVLFTDAGRDRPLADRGGSGKDDESGSIGVLGGWRG
jgi:hypothetical protein